jgi:hypothetical protein
VDPESPLSVGLQTAPWPSKFKPVSLLKYNGFGNSRQFLMMYESAVNSVGGDDFLHWLNLSSLPAKVQF